LIQNNIKIHKNNKKKTRQKSRKKAVFPCDVCVTPKSSCLSAFLCVTNIVFEKFSGAKIYFVFEFAKKPRAVVCNVSSRALKAASVWPKGRTIVLQPYFNREKVA
jgi:hypothetical protein